MHFSIAIQNLLSFISLLVIMYPNFNFDVYKLLAGNLNLTNKADRHNTKAEMLCTCSTPKLTLPVPCMKQQPNVYITCEDSRANARDWQKFSQGGDLPMATCTAQLILHNS